MTVTELACACTIPGWMEMYRAGQRPPTLSLGGDGISVNGAKVHLLANKFTKWAVSNPQAAELDSTEKIYDQLQSFGGDILVERLCLVGKIDQASRLTENIDRLAEHFLSVRQGYQGFREWGDVYVGQEFSIKRVLFYTSKAVELYISGRLDALRHRGKAVLEIVDYKLSTGQDPEQELVQLAIYQRILRTRHQVLAHGCLEYIWPLLKSVPVTPEQLDTIYLNLIEPKLRTFFGEELSAEQTSTNPFVTAGVTRDMPAQNVTIDQILLIRHTAVLGSNGSGKTTAALNIIEQLLLSGIPVVLLDRKGDLCRYGSHEAWVDPSCPTILLERRKKLLEILEIGVYTPGTTQGRSLRLPLFPSGLKELPKEERDEVISASADTFGKALKLTKQTDEAKQAILLCAFQVLAERKDRIEIEDLLTLLASEDPELISAMGHLEQRYLRSLLQNVQTFQIISRRLVDPSAELMDCAKMFKCEAGKAKLSIISTKFLGDEKMTLFWVGQFFLEILRYLSRNPASKLQALLMIDEADMYLPATSTPATKGPLESLLKRARSGGVGLMLCTQSPGDLDYKGRDNIRTWLLGAIRESRALEKLENLLSETGVNPESLSSQKVGQFIVAGEGKAKAIVSGRSCIETRQLSSDAILNVAKECVALKPQKYVNEP